MTLSRRGFLSGLGSMLAAPAIMHAGNLMPVKPWKMPPEAWTVIPDGGFIFADNRLTTADIRAIVEIMKEHKIPPMPGPDGGTYIAVPFINGSARVPARCRLSHIEVVIPTAQPGLGSLTVGSC